MTYKHRTLIAALFVVVVLIQSTVPSAQAQAQEPVEHIVGFGETVEAYALLTGTSAATIALMNGLTHGDKLITGQRLILPSALSTTILLHRVQRGDTFLRLAAQYGVSPVQLQRMNAVACSTCLAEGQLLRVPSAELQAPSALPDPFTSVALTSPEIRQGDVLIVRVVAPQVTNIFGSFARHPVRFALNDAGEYVGIIGVDARLQLGQHVLAITATQSLQEATSLSGFVAVKSGGFEQERVSVDGDLSALLDPELNIQEEAEVQAVYGGFSPQQWWSGPFLMPVKGRQVAGYGNRRIYNGINLNSYHSGYDISANGGTPVAAAAAGRVAFVKRQAVRGLMIVIDHGRGVYTGYFHLSKANVQPGQLVAAGDTVGAVGTTGRSQGNHLHFDLAVGGVTVDPGPWFEVGLP